MKAFSFLYISALLLVLANSQFRVNVTQVLSPKVASDGYLVLNVEGLKFPLSNKGGPRTFRLTVVNEETTKTESLNCYFFVFDHVYQRQPRIACRTNGLEKGIYTVAPTEEISFVVYRYNVFINPIRITDKFEVTTGNEAYFYDEDDDYDTFEYSWSREDLDFTMFEQITEPSITIYLQDEFNSIPITCHSGIRLNRLECPVYADSLPQDRQFQTYDVYIEDSLGNKKKNEFVLPVNFNLQYLFY